MRNKNSYTHKHLHPPKRRKKRVSKFPDTPQALVRLPGGQIRIMNSGLARQQIGRARGGQIVQAKGTGFRWTAETARAAILKRWKKHPIRKVGYRYHGRLAKRPRLNRKEIRQQYSDETNVIRYSRILNVWVVQDDLGTRCISEQTALRRLGFVQTDTSPMKPAAIVGPIERKN